MPTATLAQALFTVLSSDAGVSALAADRVYPIMLPQDAVFPAITYNRVTTPKNYTQEGGTYSDAHMDVHSWGRSYDEAEALAAAVAVVTNNRRFTGIGMCRIIDDHDMRDPDTGLYQRILTLNVFTETSV